MNLCTCLWASSKCADDERKKSEGATRQWPKGQWHHGSSDTTSTTITASNAYREGGELASASILDSVSVPIGWRKAGERQTPRSSRELGHAGSPLVEEDQLASTSDSDALPQISPDMIVYDFTNDDLLASLHGASIR
jgi:hypothetical protein